MKLKPYLRLTIIYFLFGVAWILLSDILVDNLAGNNLALLQQLQNGKGIFYVASTTLLLFLLSRSIYSNLQETIKKKEDILKKHEALNHSTGDAVIEYHFTNDQATINRPMADYLNISNLKVNNFYKIHTRNIHPEDRERIASSFQDFLKSDRTSWQSQYKYGHKSGHYKEVISRGSLVRTSSGSPDYIIFTLQDISELSDAKANYYRQQILFKQELSLKMIETQELERDRWATELHDNVCQVLTVAKLCIENGTPDLTEQPMLMRAQTMVEKGLNEIRQLSASLKPPTFVETSLRTSIVELLETIRRFEQVEVNVYFTEELEELLSAEQKLMVYRIVQEQLNNIVKYAAATEINIRVELKQDLVTVLIQDNGKGFDPDTLRAGIGLKNIKSRLQAFSGSFSVYSQPGHGCLLKASFCLERPEMSSVQPTIVAY